LNVLVTIQLIDFETKAGNFLSIKPSFGEDNPSYLRQKQAESGGKEAFLPKCESN
jgi:hypothetical protein